MPFLHANRVGAMVHGKPIIIKIRFFLDMRDISGFLVEDGSALGTRLLVGGLCFELPADGAISIIPDSVFAKSPQVSNNLDCI
jgi:hypothetical protein